ncbi:hypothetical protein E4U53_002304 [Claviceps sorghi]|nr:hypothetical protein E4U53_002304 [Claviceps sorghi]
MHKRKPQTIKLRLSTHRKTPVPQSTAKESTAHPSKVLSSQSTPQRRTTPVLIPPRRHNPSRPSHRAHETPEPRPLWESVKQTMDTVAFLRNKCTAYKTSLDLTKSSNEKLKGQLGAERATVADRDARLKVLEARLATQEDLLRARTREVQLLQGEREALRVETEKRAYEVRVYKTALKAAFKLPGVESQATYRSMLEITQRQVRMSLGGRPAGQRDGDGEAKTPATSSCAGRQGLLLAESAFPRDDRVCGLGLRAFGQSVLAGKNASAGFGDDVPGGKGEGEPDIPHTPKREKAKKRRIESDADSDSDSVEFSAAKSRRLTPRGSARRIVHDD